MASHYDFNLYFLYFQNAIEHLFMYLLLLLMKSHLSLFSSMICAFYVLWNIYLTHKFLFFLLVEILYY